MKKRPWSWALASGILAVACGGSEPPPRAPTAEAPPKDPAWLTGAAKACARVASCTHSRDTPRLRDPGACVDWWRERAADADPLQRCLSNAASCADVQTCMHGGGDARAAAFCAQRPGVVSGCDGDRFVSCGDDSAAESTVTDCAALGATCKELRSPGGLVQRGCYSLAKCPAGAPEARCDGAGAVLSCHDGIVERSTCRAGTTCEDTKDENAEPTASCTIRGRARCDALGARRCEGDKLVECTANKNVRANDCASVGLRCAGTGPRAGCYVPANVECDKDMLPKCEAGALVFCAAGRLTRVACASLGMTACDPSARGALVACGAGGPAQTATSAPKSMTP